MIEINKVFMREKNDCMTATLATILGIPYESVPRFLDDNDQCPTGDFNAALGDFLYKHNLQIITLTPGVWLQNLHGLHLAYIASANHHFQSLGYTHSVIIERGVVVHNPDPAGPIGHIPLIGVELLVPIMPSYWCKEC